MYVYGSVVSPINGSLTLPYPRRSEHRNLTSNAQFVSFAVVLLFLSVFMDSIISVRTMAIDHSQEARLVSTVKPTSTVLYKLSIFSTHKKIRNSSSVRLKKPDPLDSELRSQRSLGFTAGDSPKKRLVAYNGLALAVFDNGTVVGANHTSPYGKSD